MWLTDDAAVSAAHGRSDWAADDFRVRIGRVADGRFDGTSLGAAGHKLRGVSLRHVAAVELSSRAARRISQGGTLVLGIGDEGLPPPKRLRRSGGGGGGGGGGGIRTGSELPEDLAQSAECRAVWAAACRIKSAKVEADELVHGWKITWVPRRRTYSNEGDINIWPPEMVERGTTVRNTRFEDVIRAWGARAPATAAETATA